MISINNIYQSFPSIEAKIINSIIMYVLDLDLTELYRSRANELSSEQYQSICLAIEAHQKSIPLCRIFKRRKFCGLEFYISPFVLDPRPETEALVEYVLANYRFQSVLDIGVGSGCILLSLIAQKPASYGIGIDISKYALANAEYNAKKLGIDNANFYCSLAAAPNAKFDIIVSNPPYVIGAVGYEAKFDPPISLYDNAVYQEIIGSNLLAEKGLIILEAPSYCLDQIEVLAEGKFTIREKIEIGESIYLIALENAR